MRFRLVALPAFAVAVLLTATAPGRAQALRGEIEAIVQEYIATHPDEMGDIIKDYLTKHPEVLQQALTELLKRRVPGSVPATANGSAAPNADKTALVRSNAALLFNSAHQVTLGNAQGEVTMVEFFDYSCGFCKRALADMLDLMKDDPKLRIVLKELPILGPGSREAAQVAVAVRMQDPDGARYLAFHQKLLSDRGPTNKARALEVAREVGFDVARLEADMESEEVRISLDESASLARALGINGTPSYVVGETLVVGAVGVAALKDKVQLARK